MSVTLSLSVWLRTGGNSSFCQSQSRKSTTMLLPELVEAMCTKGTLFRFSQTSAPSV